MDTKGLYNKLDGMLAGKRSKSIGNNTQLTREHDGRLIVRLHSTDILMAFPDHVMLNTGGYKTVTTKARMNEYLIPAGATVYADNGTWFVCSTVDRQGAPDRFCDYMTIHENGDVSYRQ
jgi:hypothetical protein